MKRILSILVIILSLSSGIYSQAFTEITAGLKGVQNCALSWADFDSDGDLDVLISGDTLSGNICWLYRNDGGGTFSKITNSLPGLKYSSIAWGDYDNDCDPDILVTGTNSTDTLSLIFRNDGSGVFTDIGAGLRGVFGGSGEWGDYDNDGDLDILITGMSAYGRESILYRNTAGIFDSVAYFTGISDGMARWGDYDKDGDLDILLSGESISGNLTTVYRNNGNGTFTDIAPASFTALTNSSASWGDYDNDGDPDILICGQDAALADRSLIYRNDGSGTFTDISAGLLGISGGNAEWGDYDNDGDLDALLCGSAGGIDTAMVYSNSGGTFTSINSGLTGVSFSDCQWGDYNNDGKLDVLLAGSGSSGSISRIYVNGTGTANTAPTVPTNLTVTWNDSVSTFTWTKSTDTQTPQNGLSYNLRVGTTPGGCEIMSPMSLTNGYRKIPAYGNVRQNNTWKIKLPAGKYYWSVQAVDQALAGSTFATEQTFYNGFVDIGGTFTGFYESSVGWADVDNDDDLDFLVRGLQSILTSKLYLNNGSQAF